MRVKGASSREVVCMGKGLRTSMGGVRMGEGVKIYRVLNLPDSFVNLSVWEGKQNFLCLNKNNFQILQKKQKQEFCLSAKATPIANQQLIPLMACSLLK